MTIHELFFEIAKQLVHELISAANNSCNHTINVANISGRAISSASYIYCIAQLMQKQFQLAPNDPCYCYEYLSSQTCLSWI